MAIPYNPFFKLLSDDTRLRSLLLMQIEIAHINLPVAVLVSLMIIPMLLKVDLRALKGVKQYWRGVGVTLFVNWGVKPFSLSALLATLILLFGFQGKQIIAEPLIIALLAVPILIQVFFNSGLACFLNRQVRSPHCVAGASALMDSHH